MATEYSKIVLICVTKVIDGLRLGDWRAVCERAVGFGDKGQVLVVLGLECHLAPFSHLKPTLAVVVGVVHTHTRTSTHGRAQAHIGWPRLYGRAVLTLEPSIIRRSPGAGGAYL